jgi:hypothetical protein
VIGVPPTQLSIVAARPPGKGRVSSRASSAARRHGDKQETTHRTSGRPCGIELSAAIGCELVRRFCADTIEPSMWN